MWHRIAHALCAPSSREQACVNHTEYVADQFNCPAASRGISATPRQRHQRHQRHLSELAPYFRFLPLNRIHPLDVTLSSAHISRLATGMHAHGVQHTVAVENAYL